MLYPKKIYSFINVQISVHFLNNKIICKASATLRVISDKNVFPFNRFYYYFK